MTDTGHVCVATSVSPRRIDVQQRAVASWQRLGLDVVSLNSEAELPRLRRLFPDVRFVPAGRDASSFLARPYVFIRDLAATAAGSGAQVCGIVNADVELLGSASLVTELAAHARGALVFGSRVDYSNGQLDAGVTYEDGYDYVFFERALAADIPDEPYCLGAPWWDYWLPAVCQRLGLPLRKVASRIAFHEAHPAAFSDEVWLMYAGLMREHLARVDVLPSHAPQSKNARRDVERALRDLAQRFRRHIDRTAEAIEVS